MKTRSETDLLGTREIPKEALHGIHTVRAVENFPLSGRKIHPQLIRAYGQVKLACAQANHQLQPRPKEIFNALTAACTEMSEGKLDEHILVDALQGGAGTSTNLNVNEVLANRALQILKKTSGSYDVIHPIEDLNKHQSTNDTYPTALKVAAIFGIRELEQSVVALQEIFQAKEKQFARVVKIGRTQTQDAVLTTLGRQMAAYAEPLSRDRWRIYKCEERLRVVNLGGTAIGTGLGAPREYIFNATEKLRAITGIGVVRAENLIDATQNADVFVEVSGILRALGTTLIKIAGDLRFMSSSVAGEIRLPAVQAGSSIMPGKVNPVIPEAVTQAGLAVLANDTAVAQASSMGHLELNPFLPLIADKLLENIDLLSNACRMLETCVSGIEANETRCRQNLENSTAVATALVSELGYEPVQKIVQNAAANHQTIREYVLAHNILSEEKFDELISPDAVTRLGHPNRVTGRGAFQSCKSC